MRIIVVGRSKGHPQIQWASALLLACPLGIFGAAIASATYFALCGGFSLAVTLTGFIGPMIAVGAGIQSSMQLPIDQLTDLDQSTAEQSVQTDVCRL